MLGYEGSRISPQSCHHHHHHLLHRVRLRRRAIRRKTLNGVDFTVADMYVGVSVFKA
jgi:hypothetical protein